MRIGTVRGIDEIRANLSEAAANQIPYALSKALNATAKDVSAAERVRVGQVFDRPKPFTLNAFGIQYSTKQNLVASVFAKDIQNQYLFMEAEGGTRGFKTFEQLFAGGSGADEVALPGAGIKTDQYGNITLSQIRRIAADLNSSGSSKRFFKGKPKGQNLPDGIYARVNKNHHITPLMIFATAAVYKKRFDFSEVAVATFNETFARNLAAAWEQALATMKK